MQQSRYREFPVSDSRSDGESSSAGSSSWALHGSKLSDALSEGRGGCPRVPQPKELNPDYVAESER